MVKGLDTKGETTQFVDDSVANVNNIRDSYLDSSIAVPPSDINSIRTFLAKPVQVLSGSITASNTNGSLITNFSIEDLLIQRKMWTDKMSGYKFFRGTAIVKVVLNAQPFQAGRLILSFLPQYDYKLDFNAGEAVRLRGLCQRTQSPNVELDYRQGSCELRIPYISPSLWFDWKRHSVGIPDPSGVSYGWGRVFFSVLSRFATGTGSSSVDYSIYLSFEDVELSAPIFVPESDKNSVYTRRKARVNVANLHKEQREVSKGFISSTLDAFSNASAQLSEVPLIGGVASKVSSSLSSVADALAIWGLSKPIQKSTQPPVLIHNNFRGCNSNGVENHDVLALDSLNELPPLPSYCGTDLDEMSFEYLKQIPAFVNRFSWSTSNTAGTTIYSQKLSPIELREPVFFNTGSNEVKGYASPPFASLAQFFRYYRGGIVVTFKVVKTEYHSGRLAIDFTPNSEGGPSNNFEAAYLLREIVDIREGSEFEFRIPYMATTPYLQVKGSRDVTTLVENLLGNLTVRVINPLVAPATVSTSLDVLVYYRGAEDFELAVPDNPSPFYTEMDYPDTKTVVSTNIGGIAVPKFNLEPTMACIGDKFSSIKQLLLMLRPSSLTTLGVNNSFQTGYTSIQVNPFNLSVLNTNSVPGTMVPPLFGNDYISFLAPAFAFSRGGVRIVIPDIQPSASTVCFTQSFVPGVSYTNASQANTTMISPFPQNISYGPGDYLFSPNVNLRPICVRGNTAGQFDAKIPHYSPVHMRLNYISRNDGAGPSLAPQQYDQPRVTFNAAGPSSVFSSRILYRSACDDFSLGYFIGFLPYFDSIQNL